jgi:hypothetical protein
VLALDVGHPMLQIFNGPLQKKTVTRLVLDFSFVAEDKLG